MFEPEISKWIPKASVNEAGDVVISGLGQASGDIRKFLMVIGDSVSKAYSELSMEDRPKSFRAMRSTGIKNEDEAAATVTYVLNFDIVHTKTELAPEE